MLNKIPCDLIKALLGSDEVIFALEFLLKALRYIDVLYLDLIQLLCDAFVNFICGNAQLFSTRIIIEGNCRPVLYCPLEIIG